MRPPAVRPSGSSWWDERENLVGPAVETEQLGRSGRTGRLSEREREGAETMDEAVERAADRKS